MILGFWYFYQKQGLELCHDPKVTDRSLHAASGQARVWLAGKSHYLGAYGSSESRLAYAELLKQHATGTLIDPIAPKGSKDSGPTIHVICATCIEHAKTYYGKITAEYRCIVSAMRPMKDLFGDSPAKDFNSVSLHRWCRVQPGVGRRRGSIPRHVRFGHRIMRRGPIFRIRC
jgi:hypothetical protein